MIKKIRRILKDKGKSAVALLLCVSMIAPIATRALSYDSPPQTAQTWNPVFYSDYLKHYNELKGYDLEPTGLAADTTNGINRITNNTGLNFPFHAAPRIQQRPGYENPKYVDFDNHFFYCVGRHQQSGFEVGMQLFHSPSVDEYNTEHLPSFITARSNGTEGDKFNFLMLAIACGYTSGWDNKRTENAAYYLVTQSIAWEIADGAHFTGAPADAKDLMPYLNADLADFKTKWVKVLENSFPADKSPLMYSTMHSPATGYAAQCGMKNMIEEVFFNVWMAAYYSSKLYPNWQENITSTYTQVQQGDDGYYHAYVDLFQSEQASIYLTGCQKTMYGDWEYVGTVGNIEEFRSPTGEIPENGDICAYTWPENTIGELMPIDETKAQLYIFDVLTGEPPEYSYENVDFGRAQLYFSSVIEKGLTIHVRTGAKPVTPKESGYSLEIHRHEHPESMNATYNVNLYKFDSETGKPLADSHWDILERFDDSQLENTSLDLTTDNLDDMYESALGSLNQTPWGTDDVESNYNGDMGVNMSDSTLYNWANDDGSQFEKWGEDEEDPCRKDDNITGEDGKLYEADSYGNITTDVAHTDRKSYTYDKGYCDGHPAPVIKYIVCDHDADEDCDCDERNQELHNEAWAAWYEEVEHCEQLVAEGGFFHCISTDGAAKKALEEDRDQFYKDFISLTYEYSAEEITAPKGYIRHGVHTDDIPMEWRCVTSSEYKDTEEATALKHTDSSDAGDDTGSDTDTDTDDEIDTASNDSLEDNISMTSLADEASIEESSETATESNATFVSGAVKIASIRALNANAEEKEEAETESAVEEETEEETEEDATATDSDAKKEAPEISCVIH